MRKAAPGFKPFRLWPLIVVLAVGGCDAALVKSKPSESATVENVVTPVVTGDAATITTAVDNRLKQVQNELWPWVVLLLGLAGLALIGFPLILFGLAWLVRRWISASSYVGQFQKIVELKAKCQPK